MGESFQIVNIRWDQKIGGILECSAPMKNFKISAKETTNLYQMHRLRFQYGNGIPNFGLIKLDINEKAHNICSFFSGFGGSTSPDGYTANYGDDIVGIAERVVCILLPPKTNASKYIMSLGIISSRLLIDPNKMEERVNKLTSIIKKSNLISKPNKLFEYLDGELDDELELSENEKIVASMNEKKIWRYYIAELSESGNNGENTSSEKALRELKSKIKKLEKNMDDVTTQRDLLKISNKTLIETNTKLINGEDIESEVITLEFEDDASRNRDLESTDEQIGILGDMAEINTLIKQLESKNDETIKSPKKRSIKINIEKEENTVLKKQLENMTESMRGLVEDLNQALIEKTNESRIAEIENINLKTQISKLADLTKKVIGDFNKSIEEKDKKIINLENDLSLFI